MTSIPRRSFISSVFAGVAGSLVLPDAVKASILDRAGPAAAELASSDDSERYWRLVKKQFPFDEGLYYLNNASLGPSPEIVRDATENFRRALDSFPSKYMWGGWNKEREAVREKAAKLHGVSPEEIALNHNTTEGFNVIASSMDLKPGDEVIVGDHEHPSGTIPWQYWQESKGIRLVRPKLPLLPENPEELVEVYRRAVTPKTKVISMCHIVNTNGMMLPVKQVSRMAHEKGILVAVDGAQSAGMVLINLHDLECDYFAASSHKWLFSPKGMGVFYAKKESQRYLKPLIVANGWKDTSVRRFENYNTRNLPELLGLGTALDFVNLVGPEKIEQRIYELKHYFRKKTGNTGYLKVMTPAHDSLSGGITTVEVEGKKSREVAHLLQEHHGINVRPMFTHGLNGVRVSLSIFNTKADVDYLMGAFKDVYLT